ncbi:MAG: hypothetical protein ACOYT8_06690, partial [Candidatus Dependentiae bacterium]
MLIFCIFFLFGLQNIYGMGFSPLNPINIAHFSTNLDSPHFTKTHFTDLTSQRLGNMLPIAHPVTSFLINESFATANPLLTQTLVALRREYATAAFAKSSHGFSLVENYWAS